MSGAPPAPRHPVWDAPVRIVHWSLVALLAFSWWSGDRHDMDRHRLSGYAILALVLFRLFWGFAGGRTARFGHFLRGPRAVIAYGGTIVRRAHRPVAGHNPIGGWSVAAMIAALVTMVGSGLFAVDVDGIESGPLADYISFDSSRFAAKVHHWAFDGLLVLTTIHIAAILAYLLVLRTNLIGPMLHGRAPRGLDADAAMADASWWRAGIGAAAAIALAWAAARAFRF